MGLFQNSVLTKYKKLQDQKAIEKAFKKYVKYFHNPEIQQNIRESKEEQYQEGFLRELFVNILDYTINPNPNFNLTTELKNEKGAKKADGAILKDGKAIAVIELKGTKTKDLESIRQQAFDYKANQRNCVYVITSNFEKLRFYIENAIDYEEFNLFTLNKDQFELLYLCLHKDNLLQNIPLKIKNDSLVKEEEITKGFYKDYSLFKRELFRDLVKKNMKNQVFRNELEKEDQTQASKNIKLTLFKKSQKLIDRFLFIFFAEDKSLLPPNSTIKILEQWEKLKELDAYVPLYDRFKLYFKYLDQGRKGTNGKDEIFAYNGGLFKTDPILDSLLIDDDLLYHHTKKLSAYDFESQVSVNILGHIFENSLNEIESVNAEIEGKEFDKQKTKRKKDGVFYTPKYITKYIVENTVGKLCTEKKEAIGIKEENYKKNRKGRKKETLQKLKQQLEEYRNWLLQITICDPACGSGAFLNQALDFLINEHKYIDELETSLFGGGIVFQNIENTILENNIFGVDINEESVEIAKLSLWLRTAQPRRKLNSLNNNIKCGNSVIDDPKVAGNKAFNWHKEFPQVFENGGFDIVIGNPPYVRQELVKEYSSFLKNYKVFSGKGDLYTYFFEKSHTILKRNGYLGFISSGKFFEASYGKPLVDFLVKEFKFIKIINFDDLEVFDGISAYPLIFIGKKEKNTQKYDFNYCYVPDKNFVSISEIVSNLPFDRISITDFVEFDYNFYSKEISNLFRKINQNSYYLKDINCLPLVGVKTGYNEGFLIRKKIDLSKPYVFGKDLKKYLTPKSNNYIIFPYKIVNDEYALVEEENLKEVKNILEINKDRLSQRAIIKDGLVKGTKTWFEYQQINKKLDFDKEYIVYPNVSLGTNFTLSKGNVIDMTGFIIPSNDKYLLTILNSKICEFVMKNIAITRRGGYQEYKVQYLEKVPLKNTTFENKQKIIDLTNKRIELTNNRFAKSKSLQQFIQAQFNIDKLTKKIQIWHELEFNEFIKELNKVIKKASGEKLSKKDELEWMELFEERKKEVQTIKQGIDKTDTEIDKMIHKLYELTPEEIKIIENKANA